MSVIYKYEVKVPEYGISSDIKVVGLNSLLKVALQNDKICAWCEVNPHAVRECDLRFFIIPTGFEFPNNLEAEYINTVFLYDGKLVFHIYYKLL